MAFNQYEQRDVNLKINKGLSILLKAIFPIIFNVMFFVIGGASHPGSVWISYIFIHIAYLALLITQILIRKGKSAAVFGFSLYSISYIYFFTVLITGVIFIIASPENYKAAFLVQFCITGGYLFCLISNMMANEYTADSEEKRQYEIDYVKNAATAMASILSGVSDQETKKRVEKVYDAINSSPVKSHPNVSFLESQILVSISDLKNSIGETENRTAQNKADSLLMMVNERNRQLRLVN